MSILSRLFARKPEPEIVIPPLAPDQPFFVIGDVHGRHDLLTALLPKLRAHDPSAQILCVGDYVDRGEESAQVLTHLQAESERRVICLIGNHEAMLLDFLDHPERAGERWLRHGGLQTLFSYGVRGVSAGAKGGDLIAARDQLRDAMGPNLIDWLRALPHHWASGNVDVVHAGADPSAPIAQQSRDTLIWGHADFMRHPRRDGRWVVHGHTITDSPTIRQGRIATDTGAYATGRLTAAYIRTGDAEFLQA